MAPSYWSLGLFAGMAPVRKTSKSGRFGYPSMIFEPNLNTNQNNFQYHRLVDFGFLAGFSMEYAICQNLA